jgi:hypothetical protein
MAVSHAKQVADTSSRGRPRLDLYDPPSKGYTGGIRAAQIGNVFNLGRFQPEVTNMKALSVKQPWASLIAAGLKILEVRSKRTTHRGPLVICSSQQPARGDLPYRASARLPESETYPLGVTLCTVELVDCRPGVRKDARQTLSGDPSGSFVWVLAKPSPCRQVPVKGKLGIYDLPAAVARALEPTLARKV